MASEAERGTAVASRTFGATLDRRVRALLAEPSPPPPLERLPVKASVVLVWTYGSLALLIGADLSAPVAGALAVALGLAMACALLTVGHDRMHQPRVGVGDPWWWVTRAAAWPMGISEAWWRAKHNVTHHGGIPDGGRAGEGPIDLGSLARMAPDQPWRPWHVAQPLYLTLLLPLHLLGMFTAALALSLTGRSGGHQVVRPTWRWRMQQGAENLGAPVVLVGLALTQHAWQAVLATTALAVAVAGTALSLTLAVETVHRGLAVPPTGTGRDAWAHWQVDVAMTVDTPHRLTVWYVGGLNFHTEHHLYPRAPLHRLSEVADVVRAACEEFDVAYHRYPSYPVSWWRFLAFTWALGHTPGAYSGAAVAADSDEAGVDEAPEAVGVGRDAQVATRVAAHVE